MQARTRDRAIEELYRRAVVVREEFTSTALPPYRNLPHNLVASGFERGAKLNLDLIFDYLRTGALPTEEATREVVEIALGRVRDGEPLEEVLDRYRIGADYIWSRLRAAADDAERELLTDSAMPLLNYISLITTRVATACVQRAHDPRWELLERRRAIADALLTGRDPIEWADEPAIAVPESFVVAVFRLGASRGADTGELRHRIESIPGVFLRLDSGGWTALVPLQPGDDGTATVAALTARLPQHAAEAAKPVTRSTPPAPFWVGVAVAPSHADIPALFAEARILSELGRCLARSQPVCRRADLMFEYTVAAGGAARTGLAAVLAPLDPQPLLAETLEVFVDSGFNQLATARLLNIHRNTVTYRLTRVHELTGLDPHRPTDAMTLSAARIARRLESACFAP
ncbi:PucR family transcriptional regulator [Nocardia huaxiensis]|uniref:Helix-turn-helix domain-containing protein n=1 Tax=Nocardia huaxiensis TaxID=2755382 RepID=A0A7D6VEH9_9NOCA|nr:helix-turn-helix domain-containing protein [Nocardia huaxiensis]QLY27870.1 helix-turn-helix domain-containing protein [Nocardia huaxiensis]UFS98732.1 helix-turn-helix domain-containing protein [Nocardia huaxiensis]